MSVQILRMKCVHYQVSSDDGINPSISVYCSLFWTQRLLYFRPSTSLSRTLWAGLSERSDAGVQGAESSCWSFSRSWPLHTTTTVINSNPETQNKQQIKFLRGCIIYPDLKLSAGDEIKGRRRTNVCNTGSERRESFVTLRCLWRNRSSARSDRGFRILSSFYT